MDDTSEIRQFLNLYRQFKIVDLSHTLEEGIPSYPTQSKYFHMKWPIMGDPSSSFQIVMHEHNGTHIDAPSHFMKEDSHPAKINIDQLSLSRFTGRCLTFHFTHVEAPYLVSKEEIVEWEQKHTAIEQDDTVVFNFGQYKKWGLGENGYSFLQSWPGISGEAAEYLAEKQINIVGTDALSIDGSHRSDFRAHYALLGNKVLILECLNQLDRLPAVSILCLFPLKIKEGTASPVRVIALIP